MVNDNPFLAPKKINKPFWLEQYGEQIEEALKARVSVPSIQRVLAEKGVKITQDGCRKTLRNYYPSYFKKLGDKK